MKVGMVLHMLFVFLLVRSTTARTHEMKLRLNLCHQTLDLFLYRKKVRLSFLNDLLQETGDLCSLFDYTFSHGVNSRHLYTIGVSRSDGASQGIVVFLVRVIIVEGSSSSLLATNLKALGFEGSCLSLETWR